MSEHDSLDIQTLAITPGAEFQSSVVPTSLASGRYRILRSLGQGGRRKSIWLETTVWIEM